MYAIDSELDNFKKDKIPCTAVPEIFLHHLNNQELTLLDKGKFTVCFMKGDLLVKQGTRATYVIILLEGAAKVFIEHGEKEMIVFIQKVGDILGGPGEYTNNIYPFSIRAINQCKACLVEIEIFNKLLEMNSGFALEFIKDFSSNLVFGMKRLAELTLKQRYGRDRKSTRLNSSHIPLSRMPSSA